MNVSHAETISAPPEAFTTAFPFILDGVTSEKKFPQPLPVGLQGALGWSSNSISYYELEKKIWETNWKMHVLCRKDPDPRTSESLYLLPGSSPGSQTAADYRFGLLDEEIQEYTRLADLHHGLVLLRYGSSRLYPYFLKNFRFILCFEEALRVVSIATTFTSASMLIHLVVGDDVRKNPYYRYSSGHTGD